MIQYLHVYAFPDKKEYFFAFEYAKSIAKELEEKYRGWQVYDIQREFKRQKIDFESFDDNRPTTNTSNVTKVSSIFNKSRDINKRNLME